MEKREEETKILTNTQVARYKKRMHRVQKKLKTFYNNKPTTKGSQEKYKELVGELEEIKLKLEDALRAIRIKQSGLRLVK